MNDMRKIYTLLALAAATASTGFAMEQVPGAVDKKTVVLEFKFDGENSKVGGVFVAPTNSEEEYDNGDWVSHPLTENIDVIRVYRSCRQLLEYSKEVASYENVEPGAKIDFEDSEDLKFGYEYSYDIRPCKINKEGEDEYETTYGSDPSVFFGISPALPKLSSEQNTEDYTKVTITVTAPDTDKDGNPFPEGFYLSKINLEDYNESSELDPIENPEPGKSYSLDLTFPEGSSKSIYAKAISPYGESQTAYVQFVVGRDVPASPTNVQAVRNEDGSMTITWDAPEEGKNGGIYDPDITYYTVYRSENGYSKFGDPIADNLTATTYTDNCEDLTEPKKYYYLVYAANQFGIGGYDYTSDSYLVGPDYQLPYIEHFNSGGYYKEPDNIWTYKGGYPQVTDNDYYKSITGVNGDYNDYYNREGFLKMQLYRGEYEDGSSYESGKIDFSKAEYPVLTFHTVGVYDNSHRIKVQLQGASDSEKSEVADLLPSEGAVEGEHVWKKNIVALEDAVGGSASITFFAYGPADDDLVHDDIFIDEVMIDDYPTVKEMKYDMVDGKSVLSWTVPSNKSFGEPDAYEISFEGEEPVKIERPAATEGEEKEVALLSDNNDGEEVNVAAWTPSYEFDATPGKEYSVKVKPIYGDIPSKESENYEFVGNVPSGLTVIGIDKVSSVQYFDVNGFRVESPAKGQIVIKRIVGENGAVKMQKVIF